MDSPVPFGRFLTAGLLGLLAAASGLAGGVNRAQAQEGTGSDATGGAPSNAPDTGAPRVELLYHADLDGRLATPTCDKTSARRSTSDYASLIGLLDAEGADARTEGRGQPLVLFGGNLATPDLLGSNLVERGPSGIAALAQLFARGHYDAIALGHHELSMSADALGQLASELFAHGMPVVATNLRCNPTERATCPRVQPEVLTHRGDVPVGIVATVSPAVVAGIPAATFKGLALDDPATAARRTIRSLRARGAQLVVLMTQGPRDATALDQVDALSRQLATAPADERPDVIVAGGVAGDAGGRPIQSLRREGTPPIAGSPAGTRGLTRVVLRAVVPAPDSMSSSADSARLRAGVDTAVAIDTLASSGAPRDPAIAGTLDAELAAVCVKFGVAAAPGVVRGVLTRDTFTTYVLEIMRRRADAEIALINRAFVKRAPFPISGRLTRAALYDALPYRAVIGTARVSGATIDSALGPALGKSELSIVGAARGSGGIEVNGRALDKVRQYTVATIAFVASGGDGIVPAKALPWQPLRGAPDLRDVVESFLAAHTADRDGDPSVDPGTDFGPPVAARPLVVALGDAGLDVASTSISNSPSYTDAQLVRASQLSVSGNATVRVLVREKVHEADARLDLKYGWSRNQPVGAPVTYGETADLITFVGVYNYRGLRGPQFLLKRALPDPYVRARLESELTRPDVTPTQARTYHHAEMTDTAGVLFTLLPKLRVRAGAGVQRELLASGPDGRWQPVLEAGGTLDPVALATFGALAVKLEGLVDYDFVDPAGRREHQLRANGKLSVPLLPALFITAGLDVFAIQRERLGWGTSADVVAGLRLHHDLAHQGL